MHVERVTQSDSSEIASAQRLAASSQLRPSSAIRNRDGFRHFLQDSQKTYVLVSGHNDDGKFIFYGGDSTPLPILGEDCAKFQKICIFISCKSQDYLRDGSIGVKRDLTLAEGVWITAKLHTWLGQQHNQVTLNQVAAYLRSANTQASLRYHVSYFAIGACAAAGTGAAAYLIVEGTNSPS